MKQFKGEFNLVVLGAGPAGTGLLYSAIRNGKLAELCEKGIAYVDMQKSFGAGTIGQFVINSDTAAAVLLESLPVFDRSEFVSARLRKLINVITQRGYRSLPLEWVGSFLKELGLLLEKRITTHPHCAFFPETRVKAVHQLSSGKWKVEFENDNFIQCNDLVFAMGGWQDHEEHMKRVICGTLTLEPFRSKVMSTGSFFTPQGVQAVTEKLQSVSHPRVVIIGGSHSAFSSACLLLRKMKTVKWDEGAISLMYRSKLKLFYPSRDEALAEGYRDFNDNDICPLTKKVFRLAGLRLDSRDLLRQIMGLSGTTERRVKLVDLKKENADTIEKKLKEADLIIPAFGFKSRTVPVYTSVGHKWKLMGEHGNALVNKFCQVIDCDGIPLPNVYGIGLASGFVPWGKLGGEPGFSGQTNGLWLYQNGVGEMILDQITGKGTENFSTEQPALKEEAA
jgi:hypothetical protein